MLPPGYVHLSVFTLRPHWTSEADDVCAEMRARLLAFSAHPGVRSLEVLIGDRASTAHVALIGIYDSEQALADLRLTPEHDALIAWSAERFDLDGRVDVNEARHHA